MKKLFTQCSILSMLVFCGAPSAIMAMSDDDARAGVGTSFSVRKPEKNVRLRTVICDEDYIESHPRRTQSPAGRTQDIVDNAQSLKSLSVRFDPNEEFYTCLHTVLQGSPLEFPSLVKFRIDTASMQGRDKEAPLWACIPDILKGMITPHLQEMLLCGFWSNPHEQLLSQEYSELRLLSFPGSLPEVNTVALLEDTFSKAPNLTYFDSRLSSSDVEQIKIDGFGTVPLSKLGTLCLQSQFINPGNLMLILEHASRFAPGLLYLSLAIDKGDQIEKAAAEKIKRWFPQLRRMSLNNSYWQRTDNDGLATEFNRLNINFNDAVGGEDAE